MTMTTTMTTRKAVPCGGEQFDVREAHFDAYNA